MGTKAPKINFTQKDIDKLAPTAKGEPPRIFADTRTPRLFLRVCESTKTYYWYGRILGKPKRVAIGRHPEWNATNARDRAAEISIAVAHGEDPTAPKRISKPTLQGLFDVYLELHAKVAKKSWRHDEYQFQKYLQPLANRIAADITTPQLNQFIRVGIGTQTGQTTANRVRSLLHKIYVIGKENSLVETNPVTAVKKFAEQERDRFLEAHEMSQFFAALLAEKNGDFQDYVAMSLFVGQRQDNILSMRWEQVNLEGAEWRIPETKGGTWHRVPLTPEALEVLRRRSASAGDSPYVFPGNGKTGHMTRPGRAWSRLLAAAKLSANLRMHDLRRTCGSWMAAGGTSLLVIGKTLGHRDQRSSQIYARLNLDPVREAMTPATAAINEHLLTAKEKLAGTPK